MRTTSYNEAKNSFNTNFISYNSLKEFNGESVREIDEDEE